MTIINPWSIIEDGGMGSGGGPINLG